MLQADQRARSTGPRSESGALSAAATAPGSDAVAGSRPAPEFDGSGEDPGASGSLRGRRPLSLVLTTAAALALGARGGSGGGRARAASSMRSGSSATFAGLGVTNGDADGASEAGHTAQLASASGASSFVGAASALRRGTSSPLAHVSGPAGGPAQAAGPNSTGSLSSWGPAKEIASGGGGGGTAGGRPVSGLVGWSSLAKLPSSILKKTSGLPWRAGGGAQVRLGLVAALGLGAAARRGST